MGVADYLFPGNGGLELVDRDRLDRLNKARRDSAYSHALEEPTKNIEDIAHLRNLDMGAFGGVDELALQMLNSKADFEGNVGLIADSLLGDIPYTTFSIALRHGKKYEIIYGEGVEKHNGDNLHYNGPALMAIREARALRDGTADYPINSNRKGNSFMVIPLYGPRGGARGVLNVAGNDFTREQYLRINVVAGILANYLRHADKSYGTQAAAMEMLGVMYSDSANIQNKLAGELAGLYGKHLANGKPESLKRAIIKSTTYGVGKITFNTFVRNVLELTLDLYNRRPKGVNRRELGGFVDRINSIAEQDMIDGEVTKRLKNRFNIHADGQFNDDTHSSVELEGIIGCGGELSLRLAMALRR